MECLYFEFCGSRKFPVRHIRTDSSLYWTDCLSKVHLQPEKYHPHRPSVKKREQMFKTMYATPQRWASLRRGDVVEVETILNIMKYVNCSLHFLNSSSVTEYAPEKEYDEKTLFNGEILFDILDIMDACADSDAFRDLQIQLSRIVLYHLSKKGYNEQDLSDTKHFDNAKLHFLFSGILNRDKTKNYGLNYSDLATIRHLTDLSYQYMFTGIEKTMG